MEKVNKVTTQKTEFTQYNKLTIAIALSLMLTLQPNDACAEEEDINDIVSILLESDKVKDINPIYGITNIKAFNRKKLTISKEFAESLKHTSMEELQYFMDFFGITQEEFVTVVEEIQRDNKIGVDGIIWPQTSKVLYLQYYFPQLENEWYTAISKRIREQHNRTSQNTNLDGVDDDKKELITEERPKVREKDIMMLRHIIYQEMHRKHYEIDLFSKEVLWGYGDINFNAPVYPFINPEIKGIPETLDEAKNKYGKLVKRIKGNDGIIVGQDQEWRYILTFYRDNKRFLTTYVSPGTARRRTPVSSLHAVRRHDMYHRSSKYENAAMSYAVWLSGGFFFHYGVTTGLGRSHWCIRMPMMYAKVLHEETKDLRLMPFVFQPKIKFIEKQISLELVVNKESKL